MAPARTMIGLSSGGVDTHSYASGQGLSLKIANDDFEN
jgi:hypothetical protein